MSRLENSNRIVQCLWIGSKLSTIERLGLHDMRKRYNLNKHGSYHMASVFEKLKRKYLGPGYNELP